ncbi:hypothetical protein HDE_04547 [Halotydeus destructor]|nr:hypothetical protein HDE_04547 [Halotydeus destructor]
MLAISKNNAWFTLVFLACLSGLLYQVSRISSLYLSYPHHTVVSIKSPVSTLMPMFSICMPWTSLTRPGAKIDANQWTISEINEATLGFWDIFSCGALKIGQAIDDEHLVSCHEYYNVNVTFNGDLKCFTLIPADDKEIIYSTYQTEAFGTTLFLNSSKGDLLAGSSAFLHSRSTSYPTYFGVKVEQSKYAMMFMYSSISTQSLSAPFASKCRNYKSLSRNLLLSECVGEAVATQNGRWPREFKVRADSGHRLAINGLEINRTAQMVVRKEYDRCRQLYYQSDCHEMSYIVKSVTAVSQTKGHGIIILAPMNFVNVETREEPRLMLMEYACYLASITSFWYGGSVMTLGQASLFMAPINLMKQRPPSRMMRLSSKRFMHLK